MHLYGNRIPAQEKATSDVRGNAGRLRAAAVVLLSLTTMLPTQGFAQKTAAQTGNEVLNDLPAAPAPVSTEPLFLRDTPRDFSKPFRLLPNPLKIYTGTEEGKASFMNSVRLSDLVKNGKIYLSLSDALTLALENNYDLAIARYNLDIADTDILRAKSGASLFGAPSSLVTNTLGGASQTLTATGGGPGGSSTSAGSGAAGLTLSADGAGPQPENFDPSITAAIQFDRAHNPSTSFFSGGTSSTNTYNFTYNQGFVTGTALAVTFNNTYATTSNTVSSFSPELSATYKATLTQHLLQGAGIWVNKRLIQEAIYDRRITDAGFRQQILYTVNQVENIYWALVSSYEDLQSKERALEQSTKVYGDDQKQLEIGTMAPLDVVTAESAMASDKQALISSQSNLNYQQLIIKQAIARNLNDAALIAAPIIPTDRVSLDELPEEKQSSDDLVQLAFQQRPELEQAVLALKKDQITLRGAKNALLPIFDVFGYLGGSGIAGAPNKNCTQFCTGTSEPAKGAGTCYGTAFENTFNNSAPDKGIGFNLTIPLSNRTAQSLQARSVIEYRQEQLRLEQLYTQIRMQVVNQQYALTNDRASVLAAEAAQRFNAQSLDAEQKKLHLGASTTALVLQQSRNLATAEDNLIAAQASYARDRAALYQLLATTLQHYGISLGDAAAGVVKEQPIVPGLQPAKSGKEPSLTTPPAN